MRYDISGFLAWAFIVIAAARVSAHDTWLLPERSTANPQSDVRVDLTSGMMFPDLDHAIQPDRVHKAARRLAGVTAEKLTLSRSDTSLRVMTRLEKPGIATVWVTLRPRQIELTEKQVTEYLDEIGASDQIRKSWADAGKDRVWRETYMKHAKTFVRVGEPGADRSWAKPVGMRLELIPGKDPTTLRVGDALPIFVMRDGKPLADLGISAVHKGKAVGKPCISDRAGQVTFTLGEAGWWLLRGTDLRKAAGPAGDWSSDFTTLTVEVRPK